MQANNVKLSSEFLAVSVKGKADVQAMRKALISTAQYMEADLTAFTTARTLKDTVSTGKPLSQFEIPVASIKPIPGMQALPLNITGRITQPTITILKPAPIKDDVIVKLNDVVHDDPVPKLPAAQPARPSVTVLMPSSIKDDHVVKVDDVVEGSEFDAKATHPKVQVITPAMLSRNGTLQLQSPAEPSVTTLFPIRLGSATDHTVRVDDLIQDAEFHAATVEPATVVLTPTVQLPRGGLENLDQIAVESERTKLSFQGQGNKVDQLTPASLGLETDKTVQLDDIVAGPAGTGQADGQGVHSKHQ